MAYKRPVSVLVVVHDPQGRVLLIERAGAPGFWQSVTGSVEEGDASLAHTAQREVREETGICAELSEFRDWQLINVYEIYPAWRHRYAPGVTHNTEHVFGLCVPAATPVRLSEREHQAWQWLDRLAAADACFSGSNAEAVLLLARHLRPVQDKD